MFALFAFVSHTKVPLMLYFVPLLDNAVNRDIAPFTF